MLSHIGDNLHRFYLYSQLYPQSLRLREVLLRVYTLVLEFIWNGYSFFADAKRKRAFGTFCCPMIFIRHESWNLIFPS